MEEQFQEPQDVAEPLQKPQKGRGAMKWLILALLVISATLLALAIVLSPQSTVDRSDRGEAGIVNNSTDWQGATVDLLGMEMRWQPPGQFPEGSFGFETDESSGQEYCVMVFSRDNLKSDVGLKPRGVAFYPGYCFHELGLTVPRGETRPYQEEDSSEFGMHYAEVYIETCGIVYEPLGWNNMKDGSCELPDPVKVAEEFYLSRTE